MAKPTPQQLLQAAEKTERQRCELERQLEAARQKVERLTKELQETTAKARDCRAASLQAQVPCGEQLPCSAEALFEGILGRSYPQFVSALEVVDLKRQFEVGVAAVAVTVERRKQPHEADTAEAARIAKAEAEGARRSKEAAEAQEREAGPAANLNGAASQSVGMELDELDFDAMDDQR